MLMQRHDTDPRHWRALWLNDPSERLVYVRDPLIRVSQDLVRAIEQLDTEALMAFMVDLNERAIRVSSEYPAHRLGGEAAALKSMVSLSVFSCIKQAMPAIAIAGLVTALLDDLDDAALVFCADCETRLDHIHLAPSSKSRVSLCSECDRDDARWFQDIRCMGKDMRVWMQEELHGTVGDGAEA